MWVVFMELVFDLVPLLAVNKFQRKMWGWAQKQPFCTKLDPNKELQAVSSKPLAYKEETNKHRKD